MTQPTTARLDLSIWRNDDVYEYPIRVIGPDLTGVTLRAQFRLGPDVPGAPLAALETVTNGNAQGVRLAGVTFADGRYVNDVRLRLNKSTRQALPYMGEVGDAAQLGWAFQIGGRTRITGEARILAHVMDSDAAPASRPAGYGAALTTSSYPAPAATLTIVEDGGTTIVIDGADLVTQSVKGAADAATAAAASRTAADASAGAASLSATAAAGFVGGIMYATTAAGVAAVANNAFFTVVGDGVSTYATLFQKVAGVAVKKAEFASRSIYDVPGPTGADDFSMIDAVLAAAKGTRARVRLQPGALYRSSGTLMIREKSGFWLNGSTILSTSATPKRVISNPAMTLGATAVTLSWSGGLEVTVARTGHGLARGDFVWLRAADQAQYRGVFPVVRVTSADSFVVMLERTPTTAPTGPTAMVKADADIDFKFDGVIDYNNGIKSVGAGYETCAVYFAGVADFRQDHGTIIGAQKFGLALAAFNGATVEAPTCPVTNSDGCKIYGPAHHLDMANVNGLVGDDFVSVQMVEAGAYPGYQIDSGDCIGLNFRRLNLRGGLKAFTVYTTSTGPIADAITVDGIGGHPSIGTGAALLRVQCNEGETNGVAGTLTFLNVSGQGDYVLDFVNTKAADVSLHLAGARPFAQDGVFVHLDAGSVVDRFALSGKVDATDMGSPTFFQSAGGRVDLLTISVSYKAANGYLVSTSANGATFGTILVERSQIAMGAGTVVRFGGFTLATRPKVQFRDVRMQAIRAFEIRQSMSIDFDNAICSFNDLGYSPGPLPDAEALTIRVSSRGLVKPGDDWLMSATNVKFEVYSNDIAIAVDAANIARVDGAFARNVKTGVGTITEAGIVDCCGTAPGSWRRRGDAAAQRY